MHIQSVSGFTFSPYQNPCTLKRDRYTSSNTHTRHYARISIKPLQSETIQMQMLQFTKLLLKQQINYVVFFHICAPELAECMCACVCCLLVFLHFKWCTDSISVRFVFWCFAFKRCFCIIVHYKCTHSVWSAISFSLAYHSYKYGKSENFNG